ncbi:ribosomal protein S12 [Echinococcus multilocularis]|uniref:40S ribosomal protein S12 n=1 Tax=Echinococcus multilocularis TaxID=6211 RepID=A0A087W0S6_ECHMU|nr:ribosomal protein S12 [Echinococcus multilocularis]
MDIVEMDFDTALREVLKNAIASNGLVRGLHECAKAIEQRKAIVCFLAESCDEVNYTDIIEALCRVHEIPLIKVVSDGKQLGEMAGLCKLDRKGCPRKIVSASCIVVKDIGEESRGWKFLVEKHKIPVAAR